MNILKRPGSLSLAGNIDRIVVSSNYEILFVLRDSSGAAIVENSYSPNHQGRIEIDVKSIVVPLLAFSLKNVAEPYRQTKIAQTFTAEISDVVNALPQGTQSFSFTALRGGVDELSDAVENFLEQNFLTWQPNMKPVTYYSPEFLTYYAVTAATMKCRATMEDGSTRDLTMATIPAGECWTVPLQYAIIAGRLSAMPLYYDVWMENSSGQRMTYIQRYYADDMRSQVEQWVLFENSLGGIDTFRAYGDSDNTAEHTHNVVEIDEEQMEYRVDTERNHTKNTGYLDTKERIWLLDFFPSLGKYIYTDQHIRQIVVTESDVNYKAKTLPSSYTFTYRYATAQPYLNLPRTDTPQEVMELKVPDVSSFTIAPRLVEFPRQVLSRGALFPIQDPYSEGWGTTTMTAIQKWIVQMIEEDYDSNGGLGHRHDNISLLDALSLLDHYLTVNGEKVKAGYADEARTFKDNEAPELITFLQGLVAKMMVKAEGGVEFGQFITGLFGQGGRIDAGGNGEMRSLKLWEWLEVPEIRFNRITVNIGLSITSEGGGIIEKVVVDYDEEGNETATGAAYLKLEEGEYGAVAVDDLNMGLWHDFGGGNATENSDDKKGNFQLRGFKTIYFRITSIPDTDPEGRDNSDNHFFTYALRSTLNGGNGIHPSNMMHFAQRGNPTIEERQHITFATTKYTVKMQDLTDWEFSPYSIYDIDGTLDGFKMAQRGSDGNVYIKEFSGKGHVIGGAYIYGQIAQFERVGYRMSIDQSHGGMLAPGETETVTCTVFDGYGEDRTSIFTKWTLTRDSGDEASDAVWNAEHVSVTNPFELSFSDLGLTGLDNRMSSMFTVKAETEDTLSSATQTIMFN